MRSLLLCVLLVAFAVNASAHESRPAYLEIKETAAGRFDVLWRTPVLSGMRLPVTLRFPKAFRNAAEPTVRELSDSLVERRAVEADPASVAGARIEFVGLQGTITDVLVRTTLIGGNTTATLVKPSQPWIEIVRSSESPMAIAGAFVRHGVEHILGGYDHLLFVLALMLIVRNIRALVWTITAFTIAHSITLALATLDVVRVPGPPVEAAIAFSIVLLASEIVRARRGEPSLTARWPWVIAFCFGLLHGFGFAGALAEIGLPHGDIPLALFAFNVGVELGQLVFVGVLLALACVARRIALIRSIDRAAIGGAPYAIGALASFWFVGRVAAFWT